MGLVTVRAARPDVATLTIALGQSVSDAVDLEGRGMVRLDMPAGWDAASITLQVSEDGSTWRDLYDASGTEISLTVAANRSVVLEPGQFPAVRFVRLRSGTAAAAVNQSAARSLQLITRAL